MKSYYSRFSSVKNYPGAKTTAEAASSCRPKSTALEDLPDPDGGGETMTDTTSLTPVTKLRHTKSATWELSDNIPDEPDQSPNDNLCVVRGKVKEMVRLFDRNLRTAEESPDLANGSESSGARGSQTTVNGRPATPNERSPSPVPPPTTPSLAASTSERSSTTACQEEQEDPTEVQTTKNPAKRSILKSNSKGSLPRSSDRSTLLDRTIDSNDDHTCYDSTGCTRDSSRSEHRSRSRSSSRQRQPSAEIKVRWDMSPPKRNGPIAVTTQPDNNTKYPRTRVVNYGTRTAHTRLLSRYKSSEDLKELVDCNSNFNQLHSKPSKSLEKLSAKDPRATRIHDTAGTENRDLAQNFPNERITHEVIQNPVGWTARCYQLPYIVFHSVLMVVAIPASWIWNRIPTWKPTGLKRNNYRVEQSDTSSQTNL